MDEHTRPTGRRFLGADFMAIARHRRTLIAIVVVVGSSLLLLRSLDMGIHEDVGVYQGIANDLMSGKLPYRDRVVEYPPYAIPIFLFPRLFGKENSASFCFLAFFVDWLINLWLSSQSTKNARKQK